MLSAVLVGIATCELVKQRRVFVVSKSWIYLVTNFLHCVYFIWF